MFKKYSYILYVLTFFVLIWFFYFFVKNKNHVSTARNPPRQEKKISSINIGSLDETFEQEKSNRRDSFLQEQKEDLHREKTPLLGHQKENSPQWSVEKTSSQVFYEVLREHGYLADHHRLVRKKAFYRKRENDELKDLLVDPIILEEIHLSLLQPIINSVEESSKEIIKRMYQIEFLKSSAQKISLTSHREKLRELLETLIREENMSMDEPIALKKAIAGEKVELIGILKDLDHTAFLNILEETKNLQHHKVILYASNYWKQTE